MKNWNTLNKNGKTNFKERKIKDHQRNADRLRYKTLRGEKEH